MPPGRVAVIRLDDDAAEVESGGEVGPLQDVRSGPSHRSTQDHFHRDER